MPAEWALYRKRTSTQMVRISSLADIPEDAAGDCIFAAGLEGFSVRTPSGDQVVPWGSWLAIDANGAPYPVSADVHAATYEPAIAVTLLPDDVGPILKSRCCNASLQAQAIGTGEHAEYGAGIQVAVCCNECDMPYGLRTFVFRQGESILTVVPP